MRVCVLRVFIVLLAKKILLYFCARVRFLSRVQTSLSLLPPLPFSSPSSATTWFSFELLCRGSCLCYIVGLL